MRNRGLLIVLSSFSHSPPVVSSIGAERPSPRCEEESAMPHVHVSGYQEQRFTNLEGLDGLSAMQIAEHLVLYSGYVRQVNVLNDELAALRAQGRASGRDMQFAELTRRLGYEYNGMILHEYYFS